MSCSVQSPWPLLDSFPVTGEDLYFSSYSMAIDCAHSHSCGLVISYKTLTHEPKTIENINVSEVFPIQSCVEINYDKLTEWV